MSGSLIALLEFGLAEIDNLIDYYESQYDVIIENVKATMPKYRYGIALSHLISSTINEADEETLCKSKKVLEQILDDIRVEKDGDAISVRYKFKPGLDDYEKYELNPAKARREFYNLTQQPAILHESLLMMLLIKYENTISNIYRYMLEKYPQAYLANKNITYSALFESGSSLSEIKEKFITNEIDEFMRMPIGDWYKVFENKPKAKFYFPNGEFETFKEIYYRRNLAVHNQCIVNEAYLTGVKGSKATLGERLSVSSDYLRDSFEKTKIVVIGTVFALRKLLDDKSQMLQFLFNYGFNCLNGQQWHLAKYIFELLLTEDTQTHADRMTTQVNLWISRKNLLGLDNIKKEVEEMDVSAMQSQFALAKAALLDEFEHVSKILNGIIETDFPARYVKEWPLFIQYRESDSYKKFVDNHQELFAEQIVDQTDIQNSDMQPFAELEDNLGGEAFQE